MYTMYNKNVVNILQHYYTMTMITPNQLKAFGLSEKEAVVYLSALQLGSDSVQNIAKQAGIHRVSTYDILERLSESGFIESQIKGKKRYFAPVAPERILENIRDKESLFNQLIPELTAIQSKKEYKPKVLYFEGREGVWQAFLDRIRHKPELKENLVYGSSQRLLDTYPEEYKTFTEERLVKGIKTRIIIEKSKHGIWEKEKSKEHLRQVKFLPPEVSLDSSTVIYGDRILTISWDSMIAVIIEDKNNANNQRKIFELLWQYLP